MKRSYKKVVAGILALGLAFTGIAVNWNLGSEVEAADEVSEIEPVYLDEFTHVTLRDFGNGSVSSLADGEYNTMNAPGRCWVGIADALNNCLLSLKVKFLQGGEHTSFKVGGSGNSSDGFQIYVNEAGTELYFKDEVQNHLYGMVQTDNFKAVYQASEAGIESFLNHEFLLQMSFKKGDFDEDGQLDDLQVGMYFNGKLYQNSVTTITDIVVNNFNKSLKFGFNDSNSAIYLASVQVKKPFDLDGFAHATLKDFGNGSVSSLADGTYTAANVPGRSWSTVGPLKDRLLSLKVKFFKGGTGTYFRVAGSGNTSDGFKISVSEDGGELYFEDPQMKSANNAMIQDNANYKAAYKAGEAGVASFLNNEFLLQMSFKIIDSDGDNAEDDLLVGMYFNGKLYQNEVTTIANINVSNFGISLKFGMEANDNNSAIYLASVTADAPVYLEGFEHVTIRDFGNDTIKDGLADATYLMENNNTQCWLMNDSTSLNNTVISMRVKFGNGVTSVRVADMTTGFYIAGYTGNSGLFVAVNEDGSNLYLHDYGDSGSTNLTGTYRTPITYSAKEAGLRSFLNTEFLLQMSFEYADVKTDDTKCDVTIGMYFNGKLYNNQKTEIKSCKKAQLGRHFDLRLSDNNSSLYLASVDAEVHHNLADGAYSYVDGAKAFVNGKGYAGVWLEQPGDYNLTVGTDKSTRKVITYIKGDVNLDGEVDVRDLVAGKKAVTTAPDKKAAQLGLDLDNDDKLTTTDVGKLRTHLVGGDTGATPYITSDVMPIAGYWGPYASSTQGVSMTLVSDRVFSRIADMGINLITYTALDYASSPETVETYMNLCDKYRIGTYVTDSKVTTLADGTNVNKETLLNELLKYRNYPAFSGMFLVDEPATDYYGQNGSDIPLSKWGNLAKILHQDLELSCYANMFGIGNSAAIGDNAYERYVAEFCETIQPKVLMWDYYVHSADGTESAYFENMSIIREYAEKYDIPFWSFIQAGDKWHEKNVDNSSTYVPGQGQFEWNVNTSLAFGAKGIQYFPLVQPASFYANNQNYRVNGLIGADEGTNQWYEYAKKINTQIAAVDEVLMNSVNLGVLPSGDATAIGTSVRNCQLTVDSISSLQSVSGNCLIGCFDYRGKTALYVVNYSMTNSQSVTLTFNAESTVEMIQNAERSSARTTGLELTMTAGEGVLVVIQ